MAKQPPVTLATALALPDPSGIVLKLKALIGIVTPKTPFLECLNRVCRAPDGRAWIGPSLNPILESLQSRGFLGHELEPSPVIALPLAIHALSTPDGRKMVEAIRAIFPPSDIQRHNHNYRNVLRDSECWLRLCVLLNDVAEFRRIEQVFDSLPGNNGSVIDTAFAEALIDVDFLATRDPYFQALILGSKATRLISAGQRVADYDRLIAHYRIACHKDPALVILYGYVLDDALIAGRLGDLDKLLKDAPDGLDPTVLLAIAASLSLLRGDVKEAVALFSEARRIGAKMTRKRKFRLYGLYGTLHLSARLAADDPALAAELEAEFDVNEMQLGYFALEALFEMARNREPAARAALQRPLSLMTFLQPWPPLSGALVVMAAFLIDPSLLTKQIARIEADFQAIQHNVPLAADILATVLAEIAPRPYIYRQYLDRPSREIRFSFTNLIVAKQPWERALESIEAMLLPAASAPVPAAAKAKRLVWMVDPATGDIEPLEQVARGSGWTVGRSVAAKRLMVNDPTLDYLDEHDRRVAGTIRKNTASWYHSEFYEYSRLKSLPALIGHPRVFHKGQPARPITLVAAEAELVLSKEGKGFRLALSHLADEPDVFIEVEAPDRWRIVTVGRTAIETAASLGPKGLWVPAEARDRLVALARSEMAKLPMRVEAEELEAGDITDGDHAPVVRMQPIDDGVKVTLVVKPFGAEGPHYLPGIGGRIVAARLSDGLVRVRRELDHEQKRAKKLAQSCPSLGGEGPDYLLEDQAATLEFLAELRALPTPPAIEWPEGHKLLLRGEVSAKRFKASVKGAEGWFLAGGTLQVDDDLVLDLKDLLARLERSPGRFVKLDDGSFFALDRHFRSQLERLDRLGENLKLPTAAGGALREIFADAASIKEDARWKEFIKRLDETDSWQPSLPVGFEAELRDYQFDGFAWMSRLARRGFGACLADDMGLGKTVQAIGVMVSLAANGPCLVVAPTSVCGNWAAELARFAPGLRIHRLAESGDRTETLDGLAPGDVLIASYGLLAREEAKLGAIAWSIAILDEAQAIKNAETLRAKATQSLNAGFRLALSGTPVENDLDELWSLFRFVNPGLLGSRERFAKRFATPIERDNDPGAKAALKALVRPYLLRRTKSAVLSELPARTEQTILVERGAEEQAFYEALRQRALERLEEEGGARTRIHILAELTKLRLACCHPSLAVAGTDLPSAKLDMLLALVAELRINRHRALIFSQFVGHLAKVRAALDAEGIAYQYLDGSTPQRDREKRVAAFQAGEGELFLISLKAGGFGLNLTAADYVIHLDPWWNPAVEDQASDRAHRIGQLRPVTIYRLIVKDSVEEGIVALHRQKRDLADALLEGADASARLSEEDLLNMIRVGIEPGRAA